VKPVARRPRGVHGAIGLRTVIAETFGLRGHGRDVLAIVIGLTLLGLGFRAVYAVTAA